MTAKSRSALSTEMGTDFATNGSGAITASVARGYFQDVIDSAVNVTDDKGAANGVASLDGTGKLSVSQIPAALVGALQYEGTWNASTNSPALVSGTGTKGQYYKVSTAGTTAIDGESQWNVGDLIIFNGTTWDKVDGIASEVLSVLGLTGAIGVQWGLAATGNNIGIATANPPFAAGLPINAQLNASVASNILSVALKGNNGADPSSTNPVLLPFRDTTLGNGDPVWLAVAAALSINTNAVGATLGSQNGTPFRFWVVAFNNAGTVALALINCSTASASLPLTAAQIFPLDPSALQSTTAIGASATSAGAFYTPNGTALTNCSFCILGYLEYGSGLTTAGTYASAPTKVQLFGPGTKKPGETLQTIIAGTGTATTTTSNTFQSTNLTATITPSSPINLIKAEIIAPLFVNAGGVGAFAGLFRGSSATGIYVECFNSAGQAISAVGGVGYDAPFSSSAVTYTWKVRNSDNATMVYFPYINGSSGATGAQCAFSEIQG
jgi:hypothetical protein